MDRGVHGDRFGAAAGDYARHRADFPDEGLDRMAALGVGLAGQRLVDLGCGTGTVARQLAARGCRVTGLDVDGRMLDAARALADDEPAPAYPIEWTAAPAEDTGLPDGSFGAATAAQCWHWMDGHAAAIEARRILEPGGRICVCGFDWLPLPDTVPGVTEALIEAANPAWDLGGIRDPGPEACADLEGIGFDVIGTFVFDVDVRYARDSWRLRIGASAGIVGLDNDARAAFDAELSAVLDERFPGGALVTPHRVWGSVAVAPAS